MDYTITRNHFSTEAEALAEIKAAGLFPITIDIPPTTNESHWHEFDAMTFMLEGKLTVTETKTGDVHVINPGDKAEAVAGWLHRENHDGFKAVFGFSADPKTFTMPIDKPPVEA